MQTTIQQQATAKTWKVFNPKSWPIFARGTQSQEITGEGASIQIFDSVGRVDKTLLWLFEMVSSLAVLLLAFGLITSQTNVQTHGEVLSNNAWMQQAWAWTQNIAIDMSLLGAIIRACVYWLESERLKAFLYSLLSGMLLFTAAIVSNIEAVMQSVNGLSLESAYGQVIFPVTVQQLTAIRSLAIVLILVAHAVQYVSWYHARYHAKKLAGITRVAAAAQQVAQPVQAAVSVSDLDKMLQTVMTMNAQNLATMQDTLRQQQEQAAIDAQEKHRLLAEQLSQVSIQIVNDAISQLVFSDPVGQVPQLPTGATANPGSTGDTDELDSVASLPTGSQGIHSSAASAAEKGYKEAIETLLAQEPTLSDREIAQRTGCSVRTANRWKTRVQQPAIV